MRKFRAHVYMSRMLSHTLATYILLYMYISSYMIIIIIISDEKNIDLNSSQFVRTSVESIHRYRFIDFVFSNQMGKLADVICESQI